MKFIRNDRFRILLFLILFLFNLPVSGQGGPVNIKADRKPLNEILVGLRDQYSIRTSFDHQLLSTYLITADTSFSTPREAIDFLLKEIPVAYKKSFQTFVIYPVKKVTQSASFVVSGRIIDRYSRETLPYSHIRCGNQVIISDQIGNFSIRSDTDSIFNLSISYLGYYILDTLLKSGDYQSLKLTPSRVDLDNVIIVSDSVAIARQVTSHPGEVRLNPRISTCLPGNGDHSLFNLLRLQPGILAAGEQSNDLIIWGCYEGQSQVLFDGFPLYGLKNFNDQISVVNPLLIKDIKVLKGGFEPRYGNRVGGIVDITGYDGSLDKVQGDFILNNMTLNGMLSIPLSQRSSLVVGFRNTYYNLYNGIDLTFPAKSRITKENPVDFTVEPDYSFRDANLKYTGTTKNGDQYQIHLLYGTDSFSYHLAVPKENYLIVDTLQEGNQQQGISGNYKHRWNSGHTSTLTTSYSYYRTNISNRLEILRNAPVKIKRDDFNRNHVKDIAVKLDNRLQLRNYHTMEYGAGINHFGVSLLELSSGVMVMQKNTEGWLTNAYVQDRIALSSDLIMQVGIRADYPSAAPRLYLQPRASLEWELNSIFRLKTSLGKYNQFLVKSASEDDGGNIRYYWGLADKTEIPVMESRHLTFGGYLDYKTMQVHAEAWVKTYQGITRYRAGTILTDAEILHGEGRGAGLDLYVQKQIGRHSGWIAYTLSKTVEHFPGKLPIRYTRAPQDQTHEIKAAMLLDFNPVFFSACYVYGSGFPIKTQILNESSDLIYPYSRFDASVTYRIKIKKTFLEAGVSVLNIFNTQNIKVSNFVRIPFNSLSAFNVQAEAIPFTPTLFLRFSF